MNLITGEKMLSGNWDRLKMNSGRSIGLKGFSSRHFKSTQKCARWFKTGRARLDGQTRIDCQVPYQRKN